MRLVFARRSDSVPPVARRRLHREQGRRSAVHSPYLCAQTCAQAGRALPCTSPRTRVLARAATDRTEPRNWLGQLARRRPQLRPVPRAGPRPSTLARCQEPQRDRTRWAPSRGSLRSRTSRMSATPRQESGSLRVTQELEQGGNSGRLHVMQPHARHRRCRRRRSHRLTTTTPERAGTRATTTSRARRAVRRTARMREARAAAAAAVRARVKQSTLRARLETASTSTASRC